MTAQIGSVNRCFEKSSKKMASGRPSFGTDGGNTLEINGFRCILDSCSPHGRKPTAPVMGAAASCGGSEIQRQGPPGTGDARHQPAGARRR